MFFIKYSPKKREDLFFHQNIYDKLSKIKLSNNLLFYGKEGSGKHTIVNYYWKIYMEKVYIN